MKKFIIVATTLILICLNAIPVAAKSDGLFFKVKGEWNSSGFGTTAELTITADSAENVTTLEAKFKKEVWWPGYGEAPEQWISGMYQEGPLGVWEIGADNTSITVYTEPSQVSLLPSGDVVGAEPGKVFQGTITGNHVTFTIEGEPEITPLTGSIKFKNIISGMDTIPVGDGPYAICFDGTNIWITHPYAPASNTVSKIDADTGIIVDTITVGNGPYNICFGGGYIWVANYDDDTVSKIDADTGIIVDTIAVGNGPYGIVFDGTYIWVANYGVSFLYGSTLSKIEAATDIVVNTITVEAGPYAICFDGTYIWTTNLYASNKVSKINAATDTVISTYAVGGHPYVICFDDTYIWVADKFDDAVHKIDDTTNTVAGPYPVGDGPYGICSGGGYIWVANQDDDTVSKVDAATGTVVNTITVGNHPSGICFDGTYIWVVNLIDDTVSRILN
jgi:YVTN family beta-propeller protein